MFSGGSKGKIGKKRVNVSSIDKRNQNNNKLEIYCGEANAEINLFYSGSLYE